MRSPAPSSSTEKPPPYSRDTSTVRADSSPPTSQPAHQQPVPNIDETILAITSSEFYAGRNNLASLVKWHTRSNDCILIRTDNEEEAEIEWFGEVDSRTNQNNLLIDGGWKVDFKNSTPFHSVKARAHIVKPSRNAWVSATTHWDDILRGFQAIENLKSTRGATRQNTIVVDSEAIKVRHILFERRDKDDKEEDLSYDDHDTDDPFDIHNWILPTNVDAKPELRDIISGGEFKGNIIPAFAADGQLIPPGEYEKHLRGALVSIKTAVTFQHLGGKNLKVDNYYAEIREIKVISPPPPSPPSPSKKRLSDARNRYNKQKKRLTAA